MNGIKWKEWHERNGKEWNGRMNAGGWECRVYRLVFVCDLASMMSWSEIHILTIMELCCLFIFFSGGAGTISKAFPGGLPELGVTTSHSTPQSLRSIDNGEQETSVRRHSKKRPP